MKINKMPIVLMCSVVIFAAAYILYDIHSDDENSVRAAGQEYEQVNKVYESMSDNLKMIETYEETERELLDEINRSNIFQAIYQEEIINILNYAMKECNISADKVIFSEVRSVSADGGNINDEADMDENMSEQVENMTYMAVNAEFTSTYDALMLFIDRLQSGNTDISITNIQILNSDGGETVQCVISLKFYALQM